MKIEEIKIENKEYPVKLRNIDDPPKQIYVLGDKNILNEKGIAIVGSRDCTDGGIKNAMLFAKNLALEGINIISGMAKGIDGAAHKRCT